MVAVDNVLRRDSLGARFQCDGYSVFVAAAYHNHRASRKAQVTRINISWNIDSGEVSDVHRAVSVREGGCDESSLKIFAHFDLFFRRYCTIPL